MADLSHLSAERPMDIEGLRHRLGKMTQAELRRGAGVAEQGCLLIMPRFPQASKQLR